ncbi:MAG: multidrug transporter [Haloarculaceae archaeon]
MPGRASNSRPLQYVGLAVFAIAVVGTVALGWDFGERDTVPLVLGALVAGLAIGVSLARR